MDEIEAWISEPKDEEMENTQTEQQNEKKKIKEVREGVGGHPRQTIQYHSNPSLCPDQ